MESNEKNPAPKKVVKKKTLESHYGTKFLSQHIDEPLYKKIRLLQYILIEVKKFAPKDIIIEEYSVKNTFLYRICNLKYDLIGYLGRNVDSGEFTYLVCDNSRIKWAHSEGFFDDPDFSRESVFDKIGVMIYVNSINDFILFLGKQKGYVFKGEHIKTAGI